MEYRDMPGMNASTLVHGLKSMLHMKAMIDDPPKPTDAMRFGSLVHCMVLEPGELHDRYCVPPDFHLDAENATDKGKPSNSRATKYYKQRMEEFAHENRGKEFVTKDNWDRAERVRDAVLYKPKASELLSACQKEVPCLGVINDVKCKGLIDLYGAVCADLKTTTDVSERAFWYRFNALGYGFRLAFYRELTGVNEWFVIAVEESGDHDVVVYEIPDGLLDQQQREVHRLLDAYKWCLENDRWPGVDGGNESIPLWVPEWAMDEDLIYD